jgi:hypothetical protein
MNMTKGDPETSTEVQRFEALAGKRAAAAQDRSAVPRRRAVEMADPAHEYDRGAEIVGPQTGNAMPCESPGNEAQSHDGAGTLADLPPPDTKRWIARRKASVVAAVRSGAITREEACRRYGLSLEEFDTWHRAVETHGTLGLRVTRLQIYRDVPRIRPAKPRA